jgi:hypothetical protein
MTTPHTNPFVLPGMGQTGEAAGNPLLASMEMMRNAWSGLTGPGGLAQSLPMSPPMNLEDLERRISELRSIESWLRMNLSMLSSTIQGMEVQRSTIATLRSFVSSVSSMEGFGSSEGVASPLEIVLGLKPNPRSAAGQPQNDAAKVPPQVQPAGGHAGTAQPGAEQSGATAAGAPFAGNPFAGNAFGGVAGKAAAGPAEKTDADPAAPADTAAHMAQAASQAWWDMLQQQFNQIATATNASMPAASTARPSSAADAAPGAVHAGAKAGKSGFDPNLPPSKTTVEPAKAAPKAPTAGARASTKTAGRAAPGAASSASKAAPKATDKAGKGKAPMPRKPKS